MKVSQRFRVNSLSLPGAAALAFSRFSALALGAEHSAAASRPGVLATSVHLALIPSTQQVRLQQKYTPMCRASCFAGTQEEKMLPLFSIGFSFFTQKVASAQMGEAKLFDNVGTLSALATAWAACAKKFRSCLW